LTVAVTGGLGMQGSKLSMRLADMGYHVLVIDNVQRGSMDNVRFNDRMRFVNCDLRKKLPSRLLRGVETVFHLAAHTGGVEYVGSKEQAIMLDNVQINANVVKAAIDAKVRKFVYTSSGLAYPAKYQQRWGSVVRESMAFKGAPPGGYGWSKLVGEILLSGSGMDAGIVRLFNTYGVGENNEPGSNVVPELLRKIILEPDNPVEVHGNGRAYRCFMYAEDAVDAYLLMLQKGLGKGPINVGSNVPTRIGDLARLILKLSGSDKELWFNPNKPIGVFGCIPDITKAKKILGWHPQTSLEAGLTEVMKSLKSSRLRRSLKR
jgi:nucleoside-diphosphate-sugar epimerase